MSPHFITLLTHGPETNATAIGPGMWIKNVKNNPLEWTLGLTVYTEYSILILNPVHAYTNIYIQGSNLRKIVSSPVD